MHFTKLFLAVTGIIASILVLFVELGHAAVSAHRSGSNLQITWHSERDGVWTVRGGNSAPCASGLVRAGENRLSFEKVSPSLDLLFQVKDNLGETSEEMSLLGKVSLSPLPKKEGGAVIYQLAPRTYFARGVGQENSGKLSDLTVSRLQELRSLGVDYLWLTGILENSSLEQTDPDVVKGDAGSYYAITDKWDVASSIGTLDELDQVIKRAHDANLRILIDLVANHTARKHRTDVLCKSLIDFGKNDTPGPFSNVGNNYYYLDGTDFIPPMRGPGAGRDGNFDTDLRIPGIQLESPARVTGNNIAIAVPNNGDWYETAKLNYGWDFLHNVEIYEPRPKTWDQLVDVGRYWVERGVDGFRVDFAHAVPLPFWAYFVQELRKVNPQIFLVAEAYESDDLMEAPRFSYQGLFEAGFDSVYDSELYWVMYNEARRRGGMHRASFFESPAARPSLLKEGRLFTRYMENHDEVRLASNKFASGIEDRERRAKIGLAYTAYLGLMPGHLMIHGGQELQEDASVSGSFAGSDGRTSIFDYVFQKYTSLWIAGNPPRWMQLFRNKYRTLLQIKGQAPFNSIHSLEKPTLIDLSRINSGKEEFRWIGAYLRFKDEHKYIVVTNSDPLYAHRVSLHLARPGIKSDYQAMKAAGFAISGNKFRLHEVFNNNTGVNEALENTVQDFSQEVIINAAGDSRELILGVLPPATTSVFKIEPS